MTEAQFAAIFPIKNTTERNRFYAAISAACGEFEIGYPRRMAAFLGQVGHETGGLRFMQELGDASYFARYDGRVDLGNSLAGDGARYHGRGLIQLTGRANYREFGIALDLPLEEQPDIAAEPFTGARIAGRFWTTRGCNELADADKFKQITRRINGGERGLDDRLRRWDQARMTFGLAPIREFA